MDEREVEDEVQLVRAGAVEPRPRVDVEHVGLAHQDARRVVRVRQAAPLAEDLVRLRPVHRVDAPDALARNHVVA